MFTAAAADAPTTTFSDGLGTRFHRVGTNGEEDVLEVRRELLDVNSFEFAVRERVGRLSNFRHPSLAPVLRVERARDRRNALAVVSAATDGTRLSTLLALSERGETPIDPLWAMRGVHQILEAVSALHQSDRDIVHGAIGPDRIVVTSEGHAVLTDYVLGSALEQLRFPPRQYWNDLGISVHRSGRFVQRLDVRQTGLVALAALLGRHLSEEEGTGDETALRSAIGSVSGPVDRLPFVGDARQWLRRALEIDSPFPTARDAADAVVDLLERHRSLPSATVAFEFAPAPAAVSDRSSPFEELVVMDTPKASPAATTEMTEPIASDRYTLGIADLASALVSSETPRDPAPLAFSSQSAGSMFVAGPQRPNAQASALAAPIGAPAVNVKRSLAVAASPVGRRPWIAAAIVKGGSRSTYMVVAAVGLVVVAATIIAYRAHRPPQALPVTPIGTLTVTTAQPGATVRIDQSEQGVTPMTVKIAAGEHVIELRQGTEVRRVPVTVKADVVTAQYVELSDAPPPVGALRVRTQPEGALVSVDGVAAGRSPITLDRMLPGEHTVAITGGDFDPVKQTVVVERGAMASILVSRPAAQAQDIAGWIGITSPFTVEVFERGGLIGSSVSPRLMLSAGTHQLELVNAALGYRVRRSVTVGAGKVTAIKIDPPTGTVSLNANPWATVWLDGEWLGETPIGNMQATVGTHQVVFRHPTLGEQRRTITVTADGKAHLGVDFARTR